MQQDAVLFSNGDENGAEWGKQEHLPEFFPLVLTFWKSINFLETLDFLITQIRKHANFYRSLNPDASLQKRNRSLRNRGVNQFYCRRQSAMEYTPYLAKNLGITHQHNCWYPCAITGYKWLFLFANCGKNRPLESSKLLVNWAPIFRMWLFSVQNSSLPNQFFVPKTF